MTCSGGKDEEDDNKEKWEVLGNIYLALNPNGMSDSRSDIPLKMNPITYS